VSDVLVVMFLCAAVAVGIGVLIDRGGDRILRLANWPFPTMPATNGALFGLLLVVLASLAIGVRTLWR
jgi:hypothetical protein